MTALGPVFYNKTAESRAYSAIKFIEKCWRLDQPVVFKPSLEVLAELFDNWQQKDTPRSSGDLLDSLLDTLHGSVRGLNLQLFT